mmetsp:Transcript_7384/g.17753  ORF Transcript_7384/g.17753 Transcript_7384/m.17753 type:complete len:241 (+) Transcript_7384:5097-5819(+)
MCLFRTMPISPDSPDLRPRGLASAPSICLGVAAQASPTCLTPYPPQRQGAPSRGFVRCANSSQALSPCRRRPRVFERDRKQLRCRGGAQDCRCERPANPMAGSDILAPHRGRRYKSPGRQRETASASAAKPADPLPAPPNGAKTATRKSNAGGETDGLHSDLLPSMTKTHRPLKPLLARGQIRDRLRRAKPTLFVSPSRSRSPSPAALYRLAAFPRTSTLGRNAERLFPSRCCPPPLSHR